MTTFYVDWKPLRLDVLADEDAEAGVFLGSLEGFVRERAPCRLILESTFESFNPAQHNLVVDVATRCGVELLTIPPRVSGRRVRELFPSFNPSKDDPLVPLAIRDCVKRGTHLSAPRMWDVPAPSVRRNYEVKRRSGGFRVRDPWVKERLETIPPFSDLPAWAKAALGTQNGKRYDLPFVMSMLPAFAEARGSRDLLNRVIGACGSGYPSFYRSQFQRRSMTLFHRVNGGRRRRASLNPDERKTLHARSKGLRAAIAFVYHGSRESQINLPPSSEESHYNLPVNTPTPRESHMYLPFLNGEPITPPRGDPFASSSGGGEER